MKMWKVYDNRQKRKTDGNSSPWAKNAWKQFHQYLLLYRVTINCKFAFYTVDYRPYALTSRLHNNNAMLGVKTCRAARTCCAGRALALSASQSVRGPGPARRYGMQGVACWLHAWRWCTWQCLVWPPTRGGALLWRHMHKVCWLTSNDRYTCKLFN